MISILEECCVGCALCVPFCPEEAISCYGRVDVSDSCTECLTCLEFCPVGALKEPEQGE